MAGGKETPRQKLIGMMYLVLLAMLALQVSGAVLHKFLFINQSLENTVVESSMTNQETVSRIQKQVEDAGNRKADVAVIEKASAVRQRTRETLEKLDALKAELVKATGGYEEDEVTPKGLKNEEVLANRMINQKEGEALKQMLNDYAAFLNQTAEINVEPIAFDGDEHPIYSRDPEQKKKDFSTLNFAQTPLVGGLATITQFETEILMRESAALDKLARAVGAEDVKFDVIVPMVNPESKVVAAGTKYEAKMFIAASSSGMTPDMYIDGKKIKVGADGKGIVEFPATATSYDEEGLAKKTFKAEIKVTLPGGRDTTYTQVHEYYVAKPVIQVQSASVQALYLQCGNELNVQVPALGNTYNPQFSADGASVFPGKKRGEVTLVPNSANVKLNVSSGGTYIGSENFRVRLVPKPELIVTNGAKELDMRTGVPATSISRIVIKAESDASFAEFLPKDARFRVAEYKVYLARGNRPVDTQVVKGPEANLRSFAAKAKAGDRLVFEVTKVQRMNFKNDVLDVPMGTKTFTVPLN